MPSLTIVSGSPGTGKTTLARALAQRLEMGLHFESDGFYRFPAHPVDPADPASNDQNTTVMRALGRAASAFVEGGYEVFLDGVVGPWLLPTLTAECPSVDDIGYIILTADLDLLRERVSARGDRLALATVAQMQRGFAADERHAGHRFDTTDLTPDDVVERVAASLAAGRFRLQARG